MCPYDHGMDRIVVDEGGGSYPGSFPNNPVNTMARPQPPYFGMPGMMGTSSADAYDPERAGLMAPAANMTGFPPEMGMMNPSDMSMMAGGGNTMRNNRPRGGRGAGRGGRGGRHHYQSNNPLNTTLAVEKIPIEYCQISTVNDFFAKFGNITNISVQPHQQKAIIQYGSRAEAEAAYNSPDAIFDNRFVKVYWHKDDSATATPPVSEPPKSNEPDPELIAARAAELAKEREEKQKKHNERMKTILELQKQKEHLIQLQIAEQKRLLGKLTDSANLTPQEKEGLLKALKKIQSEIDASRAGAVPSPLAPTDAPSAAEDNADPNKPESSEDLKKKLARLEAEASHFLSFILHVDTNGKLFFIHLFL
jgi:RNA-binding protein 26